MHRPRRRLLLALAAVATVAAGLAVHFLAPAGPVSDAVGDVLYAALIALLVAFVAPCARWRVTAAVALGWCVGVELLQLTPLPSQWAASFPPLRLVFGTGFSLWDLLWYAVGVALVVICRMRRGSRRARLGE
ncbi:DUF2809 domain-containing protein [Microbacterium bovistercoris]|uniref:DUF2809 domain-containing protein n=1 Tax=Microbacterium bovistercoris TaxID=2293570 RepID=A0A371NYM3_9MICO|nr:DUF2809 domain-containing protein [Microbacterium bovistercoris]REJ07684.1 DUF2809 domain-containing protein [Microbacterium bovistercoris]